MTIWTRLLTTGISRNSGVAAICKRYVRSYCSGRRYSEKHEWVIVDKQIGCVGISNHAQEALGDVVFVQLPEVGSSHSQFAEVGAIESVKAASELLTPVSGTIKEINDKLETKPALVNQDCYNDGWLFKIELTNDKELDGLMDEKQYQNYIESKKDI